MSHAGVKEAMFIKVSEDYENGQAVYDIEFYSGNQEYDYEISKATGAILSYDYDIEGYQASTGTSAGTSIEEVKRSMLGRVAGANESHIRIWQDWDDGRMVYEGNIYYNNVEYEFEVDGTTGQLVEWSSEHYGR